jgi:dTDP-4-dehydrorhamnose 3,5-epimerase
MICGSPAGLPGKSGLEDETQNGHGRCKEDDLIFEKVELPGAFVIQLEKIQDQRGFVARSWCEKEFKEHGLTPVVHQANVSCNIKAGTLRGMHYQVEPYGEAKTVRCTRGAIYDVIIDLRQGSPTWKRWFGLELNADNYRMLYVPENFGHGFLTLTDNTEVTYMVSEFYTPGAERGIRWNDPAFGITWPRSVRVISEKDTHWPDWT